jgi:hypothetical protein
MSRERRNDEASTYLGGWSFPVQFGDPVTRQIEEPQLTQATQRSQGELAKLVVRQVEAFERSEGIKGTASIPIAVRATERLERIVPELEVLQHLSL